MRDLKDILKWLFLIKWLFFTLACSPPNEKTAKPLLIDKHTLSFSEDGSQIQGSGRVLFQQPLSSLNSRALYQLRAEFFHPESQLILHSHFQGFKKRKGVKIFFTRKGSRLLIEAQTPRYKKQQLDAREDFFASTKEIYFYVEVQNGSTNFIRIRVWNLYFNPTGYLRTQPDLLPGENLMLDSLQQPFYSKGGGILWGLELNKIHLLEAERKPEDRI